VETALPWRQRLRRSSRQWYVVKACGERCGQWWWTLAWGRTWTTADPTKHDQQGWQHECWCTWWWWWRW
jgi:hypothetical protein